MAAGIEVLPFIVLTMATRIGTVASTRVLYLSVLLLSGISVLRVFAVRLWLSVLPGRYPYGYGYGYPYDISGSLRLQVNPREAEVFVDGYYAGTVDNFDGTFQRLHVEPGEHDLEVFMPGHRSYQQKVYLQPGKTFNVRHAMEPLGPGDAEPARPAGNRDRRAAIAFLAAPAAVAPRDRDADADPDPGPERASQSEFGSLAIRVQPGDASITIDGEAWENAGTERAADRATRSWRS